MKQSKPMKALIKMLEKDGITDFTAHSRLSGFVGDKWIAQDEVWLEMKPSMHEDKYKIEVCSLYADRPMYDALSKYNGVIISL